MVVAENCPVCSENILGVYLDAKESHFVSSAFGPSRNAISSGLILRCDNCRFAFAQLRPSEEVLGRVYQEMDGTLYEAESEGRSISALKQLKLVERYARPPGRLLDVGCASGQFLQHALNSNWEVEGIEPCVPLAHRAQDILGPNAQIHLGALQSVAICQGSFDIVTLWDVLEHVADPVGFLLLAKSLLKPEGIIFANVPNLDSIQAKLLKSRWPLLLPEHLNYFNRTSLELCGAKAGLRWSGSCHRAAAFSIGYLFYRLQQHEVPLSAIVSRLIDIVGANRIIIRIPLGEICGVWKR